MSINHTPGGTIDPNSFTEAELLKHIYRTVVELGQKMDAQEKERLEDKRHQDGKVEKVNERMTILETKLSEKERYFKVVLTIISTVFGFVSVAIAVAAYFLK